MTRTSVTMRLATIVVATILSLGVSTRQAEATPITGMLWAVPDAIAQNAILANIPGTAPNVTFDVNAPLNFSAGLTPTVQQFLNSGGAFNVVAATPGDLTRALSDGVLSTLMEFTGFVTVTTGEQFTVTHDDGLTLIIGGVNLGFNPGPTAPIQSTATYTGPTGTFPFQLVYGECCAGAAVLQIDLPFQPGPTTVPEPATLSLIGCGLASIAARRRLRRRR
jgi:hypothetical protein